MRCAPPRRRPVRCKAPLPSEICLFYRFVLLFYPSFHPFSASRQIILLYTITYFWSQRHCFFAGCENASDLFETLHETYFFASPARMQQPEAQNAKAAKKPKSNWLLSLFYLSCRALTLIFRLRETIWSILKSTPAILLLLKLKMVSASTAPLMRFQSF